MEFPILYAQVLTLLVKDQLFIDGTSQQMGIISELQQKLYVSEMLLKKLYVQNQELTEKLAKANEKITEMDKDHRVLQKQHLLLQHNIQNKIIGILNSTKFSHKIVSCQSKNSWV